MEFNEFEIVYFLKLAYYHARDNSTDPSTQNGAILVDNHGSVLIAGANHFPPGVSENSIRWKSPLKYKYVEHAERDVIYKSAACGIPTHRKIMVCPWYTCTDCARAIIEAGIVQVIGHKLALDRTPSHWLDDVNLGLAMLQEAGVQCDWYDKPIFIKNEITLRFNKELWTP